ncbi:MAG: DUF72 domain-containing protein [Candidatus Micrarchaeaceae archaeon]
MESEIIIGCCGIRFFNANKILGRDWKKRFASRLDAYASLFSSLEEDSTFYSIPGKRAEENWKKVHDSKGLEFIIKAPKEITHTYSFRKGSEKYLKKIERFCSAIGSDKILFQTPPSFEPSEENLENAERILSSCRSDGFFPIFEPRGRWLARIEVAEKFCKNLAILCTDPLRNLHSLRQEFNYFRLHGFGKKMVYSYNFSEAELRRVLKILEKYGKSYAMFNNTYMYENALELKKIMHKHQTKK